LPDLDAMQQGQRPRDLRDISHLYLSRSRGQGEDTSTPSALVAMASIDGGPLRAWLSAGLAAAFASQKTSVTLLDAGAHLPNAGYYFALRPGLYLRPVLDEEAVVEADDGGGVRVRCSRDPCHLKYGECGPAKGPRVIMISFQWDGSDFTGGLRELFDSVPPGLPAVLLTVSDRYPGGAGGISRAFDRIAPGAPVMALYPEGDDERREKPEPCPFPVGMLAGLSRRMPPSSSFLTGLAAEILQRLGSRKRGAVRDRIG